MTALSGADPRGHTDLSQRWNRSRIRTARRIGWSTLDPTNEEHAASGLPQDPVIV